MRDTKSQATEGMTDDPRTRDEQRTREVRPADLRTNAVPGDTRERAQDTRERTHDARESADASRERTHDARESADASRERTHDARERADASHEPADAPRETARPRQPDRAEQSAYRNGSRMEPAERVQHSPGEVHSDPIVNLWPDRAADGLRERWRELQLLFVDDPKAAVAGADAVLGETIEVLNGSLQAARSDLSDWRNQREVDTEGLRVAVQRYRNVLDRVLAL